MEPTDDPVPMFRARRGQAPGTRQGEVLAGTGRLQRSHGHLAWGPAPLVSGHGHGHTATVAQGSRSRRSSEAEREPQHAEAGPARRTQGLQQLASRHRPDADSEAIAPYTLYAAGISHPDEGEAVPMRRSLVGSGGTSVVITRPSTPRVSAAPAGPVAQPPVVQGFGSEVVVPSSDGGDRPGGTRRRNHPSNWTPESMVGAPELLEEREAITEAAVTPAVLPEVVDRSGRLVMPAPLRGSHDILLHQNLMAVTDGLERIQDDADLDRMRAARLLVNFPTGESLRVSEDLPENRRCARPWTVTFVADMAHAFYARFHQPLQVNSAARSIRFQARLQLVNGNAAGLYGDAASPHLTGQAVDIGKRFLSHAELAWMRDYLTPWIKSGKIDVEEEFQQACFHISVYRSYAAGHRVMQHQVAQVKPATPAAATESLGDGPEVEVEQ